MTRDGGHVKRGPPVPVLRVLLPPFHLVQDEVAGVASTQARSHVEWSQPALVGSVPVAAAALTHDFPAFLRLVLLKGFDQLLGGAVLLLSCGCCIHGLENVSLQRSKRLSI